MKMARQIFTSIHRRIAIIKDINNKLMFDFEKTKVKVAMSTKAGTQVPRPSTSGGGDCKRVGNLKKRRLKGVGSILPDVPIPHEMQKDELIKYLVKSTVVKDEIIAINKPAGLPIKGHDSGEVNFLQLLPEVADAIGHPSAEIVNGPERATSGVLLLGHNKAMAQQLSEAFSAAKKTKKLSRTYWAVTVGIPSPTKGVINEVIGYEKIAEQILGVIKHDPSKGSFRRKSRPDWKAVKDKLVNKRAETQYNVLSTNEQLQCALVELRLHKSCRHQLQVHMTHRLHPILGDHLYSSRVCRLLGVPVLIDPQEALPATQDVGPVLKQALLIRKGLLHMLPLHLHLYEVTLPKWRGKTDVCIRVPPPNYFGKTLELLDLSPPLIQDS